MNDCFLDEITGALSAYIHAVTSVSPPKGAYRLSRTGELALNAFVRADAESVAAALQENRETCLLWGLCPFLKVRSENGWILFTLSPAFYETLCEKAAALGRAPGTDYVSLRMRMLMRKPASPCPDRPTVHLALLRSVFAEEKGHFTAEDDRTILIMTHGEKGAERLALENSCGTVARALLMLRSPER